MMRSKFNEQLSTLNRELITMANRTVDGSFTKVKTLLIERLRLAEADAERALDLLMIGKYLERIGGHAVNIAKWVVFSITGDREVTS